MVLLEVTKKKLVKNGINHKTKSMILLKKIAILLGILFLMFPVLIWQYNGNFSMLIGFLLSGLFLIIYGLFDEEKEV